MSSAPLAMARPNPLLAPVISQNPRGLLGLWHDPRIHSLCRLSNPAVLHLLDT